VATRDGRRREFAAFAEFAGEEVPDPQDAATFERSKLTRKGDERLLELHRRLLSERRGMPRGEALAAGNEEHKWLRVRRDDRVLAMNFAREERRVPLESARGEILLATHDGVRLDASEVVLPPLAGALVR
jgi:maltooligosyltrehalose trehalohydrolase